MTNKAVSAVMADPIKFAVAAAVVLGVGYFLVKTVLGKVAAEAGGLVSGRNAITDGTPYAGAGAIATPAAIANAASGGTLADLGGWLGRTVYDWTHEEYDPNTGLQTGAKTTTAGAKATDSVWGRIGGVVLRAQ
jgi:hypothetical protein